MTEQQNQQPGEAPSGIQASDEIAPAHFRWYWEKKHQLDSYRHPPLGKELAEQLRFLFTGVNGFVLDHGCGGGRVSLALARLGCEVALSDLSGAAVTHATDLLQNEDLKGKIAWAHAGPVSDWTGPSPWSGFVSHRVLHALPRSARFRAWKVLAANLAPGGRGFLSARSVACERHRLIQNDSSFEPLDLGRTFYRPEPFRFIHFFNEEEIETMARESGLEFDEVREFRETTGNLERKPGTRQNVYWRVVVRKPLPG